MGAFEYFAISTSAAEGSSSDPSRSPDQYQVSPATAMVVVVEARLEAGSVVEVVGGWVGELVL